MIIGQSLFLEKENVLSLIEVINNPDTGTMVYIANTNIGMPLSVLVVVTILVCMMFAICIKKYKYLKK